MPKFTYVFMDKKFYQVTVEAANIDEGAELAVDKIDTAEVVPSENYLELVEEYEEEE